ncbi:MAG: hypothetical protein IKC49_02680 [Clostridia bacterium]|nr:hypothetical protein [Clostridia bacterium]
MTKKTYKNAIETKKKISTAYLELLSSGNTQPNVTDLVDRAKINRGTFYLHFKNISEVSDFVNITLSENFKGLEREFRSVDIDNLPSVIIGKVNEILSQDLDYYKLLINASDNCNIMDKIKYYIIASIYNNFKLMKYITNLDRFKTAIHYIVSGILAIYIQWFKGEIEGDLSSLCEHMTCLISSGLKGYIKTL